MIQRFTALVDENNCIGCGKCSRVCPTDAIVGAKHVLHTVIPQLCTSCEECVNACPTDCISLKTPCQPITKAYEELLKQKKQTRLLTAKSFSFNQKSPSLINTVKEEAPDLRKQQIADAIARVKARKNIVNKS